MNKFLILLCYVSVFLCFINSVSAEVFTLPNVVVKDSVIEEKEKTSFTKTVINVESQKMEEKSVADIIENVPGVNVTKLAGRGSYSVVSIRGSTSSQVLVYIDGVLINGGGNSSVDLSNIPVEQIKKIEIYRGNIPAKFGRGGIGGVVHILTKKNIKERSNISLSTGSWKFYSLNGNLKFNKFFANGSYEARTGDYPYLNDANTPFNTTDDYHAHRQNNYYNQKSFLCNYKLPFLQNILSLTYRHFDKLRDLPGAAPGRDKSDQLTDAVIKKNNNHFDINYSLMLGKGVASIQPFYEKDKKDFYNPKYKLGMYGLLKSKYVSSKYGFNLSYEINSGDFLNLGIYNENRYEIIRSYFTPESSWVSNLKYKRIEHNFTIGNDFRFFKNSLVISPVLRKNILKDKNKKTGNSDFFSKNSYSIGVKLTPYFFKNIYLKFNYGHFVRFPNFYEKFGDGATLIPNSNLKYERSKNLDYGVGFKWDFFNFEITFFKNKVKNLIEFVMVNERYSMYKNIEDANIKGYEANLSFNIENIFLISANYTKLDSESEETGYKKEKPLPNRPGHKTFVRVQTNLNKFSTWLEYHEIGKNYFDDGGYYYYNTYDYIDTGVIYKLNKTLTFSATIKNLTNNQDFYAYAKGYNVAKLPYYPVEGRHFYFKVNYSF